MRAFTFILAALATLLPAVPAGAEKGLSDRPVTVVVPFTPGTGPDTQWPSEVRCMNRR